MPELDPMPRRDVMLPLGAEAVAAVKSERDAVVRWLLDAANECPVTMPTLRQLLRSEADAIRRGLHTQEPFDG